MPKRLAPFQCATVFRLRPAELGPRPAGHPSPVGALVAGKKGRRIAARGARPRAHTPLPVPLREPSRRKARTWGSRALGVRHFLPGSRVVSWEVPSHRKADFKN